jgi:hypothetical protein
MRKNEPLILNKVSPKIGSNHVLVVGSFERPSLLVLSRRFDLDLRGASNISSSIRKPSYWVRQVDSLYHKSLSFVLITLLFFSPFFPVVTFADEEEFSSVVVDQADADLADEDDIEEAASEIVDMVDETEGSQEVDLVDATSSDHAEQELDDLVKDNNHDDGETVEELIPAEHLNGEEEFVDHEEGFDEEIEDSAGEEGVEEKDNADEDDNETTESVGEDDNEIIETVVDDEQDDVVPPSANESSNEELNLSGDESIGKVVDVKNSLNFLDEHCTLLSERELYCVMPEEDGSRGEIISFSDVQSRVMPEGNREIILQRGEVMMNISSNGDENVNPSYSKESGIVVWQRLIGDRWQISVHNLVTGSEFNLTNTTYNNVNPHIYMNTVVWQGWMDESWDIFSTTIDRYTDNGEMEIKRITADKYQNTNPEVFGSVVMWQSYINNTWQVFIHDLGYGLTTQVSEGLEDNRNARLAILWENENQEKTDVIQFETATKRVSRIVGGKVIPDNENGDTVPEHPVRENQSILPLQNGRSFIEEIEGDDDELE